MAYSIGLASDQVDLLQKLETFVVANGWTSDASFSETYSKATIPGGPWTSGWVLRISRTDSYGEVAYFNFYACYRCYPFDVYNADTATYTDMNGNIWRPGEYNGIAMNGSTGAAGGGTGADWCKRTGYTSPPPAYTNAVGNGMCYMAGQSMWYSFYAQGDSIHVVVEIAPNVFQHMSFGTLVKMGTYTGGQYFSCSQGSVNPSYWGSAAELALGKCYQSNGASFSEDNNGYQSGAVRVVADGITNWRPIGRYMYYYGVLAPGRCNSILMRHRFASAPVATTWVHPCLTAFLFYSTPSALTGLTPQMPIHLNVHRTANDQFSNAGYPEGVRALNVKGLSSKSILSLSGDDWQVFPLLRSDPVDDLYELGVSGLSYLQ